MVHRTPTDTGNAELFASEHAHRLRYVAVRDADVLIVELRRTLSGEAA